MSDERKHKKVKTLFETAATVIMQDNGFDQQQQITKILKEEVLNWTIKTLPDVLARDLKESGAKCEVKGFRLLIKNLDEAFLVIEERESIKRCVESE
jgi:hypothetical protein